jgi:hypothetical protein
MIKKNDLDAAYRDLIAEGRQRLGEPPTAEEVAASLQGELPEKEAARVRELLVYYPELVSAHEAPILFPYEGKPGDADYLSEEELARDWASLQARIHAEQEQQVAASPAPAIQPAPRPPAPEKEGWFGWIGEMFPLKPVAAGATLLAILFCGLSIHYRVELQRLGKELREPRFNLEHRLLLPDGKRGGAAEQPPIPLTSEAEFFLLIPALINHPPYPAYRLEILDLSVEPPRTIWEGNGLRRRSDDTFEIWVPRAFLKPGNYRLDVYGVEASAEKLLETYTVRLSPQ